MVCSSLASHCAAYAETYGKPGYVKAEPPMSRFIWALASMSNATLWNYMDAAGVATAVDVASGSKWWVLADRRVQSASGIGDVSSIHCLEDGWE